MFLLGADGDLERRVAVGLRSLDLDDPTRRDLEDGDRNDLVVPPHLRHSQFFAHDGFTGHGFRSFTQTLRMGMKAQRSVVSVVPAGSVEAWPDVDWCAEKLSRLAVPEGRQTHKR